MIGQILQNEISKRGISVRRAAKEIGVAHTTIQRVIKGDEVDLRTISAIGHWLHVGTAELLNISENQTVKNQVSYLVERNPHLVALLSELIKNDGLLRDEDLAEILEYANFKIIQRTHSQQNTSGMNS